MIGQALSHFKVATIVVTAFALACGAPDAGRDESDSKITVLFESDDYVLGPSQDDSPKYLVFLPLVRGYAAQAEPLLAESWEHSTDFRTWTFHLRRDVLWHDGVRVTAHDIAFCLELFAHPDVQRHGVETEAQVSVPDDHTLVLKWEEPKGPHQVLDGWTVYYPKHLLEGLDPKEFHSWEFWTRPVGNGPYRWLRSVTETMVALEANPDYFAGKPTIEQVVLKLSTANKVTELTSGNADAAYYLPAGDVLTLSNDPRFRVYHMWAFSEPQAIHWNQAHPFLADAQVRRALSHAIDRQELLRVNNLPEDTPLVGGLSPEDRAFSLYREGRLDSGPHYDPDLAQTLLDDAGWIDLDNDGVRERLGVEARLTMMARQGGLSSVASSLLIQDQLREVGVDLEIRPVDPSVWRQDFRAREFDATIWDVPNVPEWLLRRDSFGEGSSVGYRNPEIVAMLERLELEMDAVRQDALYASINDILSKDVPFTFLFPYVEAAVAHRRIKGLRTPDRANLLELAHELWLENDG